jgi:hypothetical protein
MLAGFGSDAWVVAMYRWLVSAFGSRGMILG